MKTEGTITTGLGKGSYFLSQDFYKRELEDRCGFIPYPGTLNIVIPQEHLEKINEIKTNSTDVIKPDEGFGAVSYISAILNDEIKGAIIFPAKTVHEENYLEFIAEENLRKTYGFEDDDVVKLEIEE